jgi:hypothetical protein
MYPRKQWDFRDISAGGGKPPKIELDGASQGSSAAFCSGGVHNGEREKRLHGWTVASGSA